MNRSNSSKTFRLLRAAVLLLFGGLLGSVACSRAQNQEITGETHFLRLCDPDSDACGEGLTCACGICTRACDALSDCAALPRAECVSAAASPVLPACEGSEPPRRCDASCSSDADCRPLSSSHRCELGFCRAGSSSSECTGSEVDGNQVVVLGDTFMALTHQITAELEELARGAGALPAGQRYRDESTIMNNALALNGKGILNQYGRAAAEADVAVVIMNGGGADVLTGTCDSPPLPDCPIITAAVDAAEELFAQMAADGVSNVVYAFYPNPIATDVRDRMDVLRPELQAACEASPVPCHWLDLRPVFEGHYDDYILPDGLDPTATGATAAASAIWTTMQANCIAQ